MAFDVNLIFEAAAFLVAIVVWLVRLEGRINYTEKSNTRTQKDVDDLRARHESLDSKIIQQLNQLNVAVARIEGSLGIKKED